MGTPVRCSRICTYRLLVTGVLDKQNGLYTGKVAPDVFEADVEHCKNAKDLKRRQKGFENLPWDCYDSKMYPNQDTEYAFVVVNDKNLETNKAYNFSNVPYKTDLKKIQ